MFHRTLKSLLVASFAVGSLGAFTGASAAADPSNGDPGSTDAVSTQESGTETTDGGKLQLTDAQKADLDARAAETLRNSKPGGERIAPDKIAWDDGDVILTLAIDGEPRGVTPQAPNGRVYLYDNLDFTGDTLSFYECKFQKLRDYNFTNRTSSWLNNRYDRAASNLLYWTGYEPAIMDHGFAVHSNVFAGEDAIEWNNRADFLRVCRA